MRLRSSRSRTSNARRDPRGAISRSTPCPRAWCHSRRAIIVRSTSSANSGQEASMARSAGRSKAITSVGSSATHSAIAGSPVNVAMSPRKVPASASATQTSLPGLRSSTRTRPRSTTRKGASRPPCAYSVSPGRERRRVPSSASRAIFGRGQPRIHQLVAEVREVVGAELLGSRVLDRHVCKGYQTGGTGRQGSPSRGRLVRSMHGRDADRARSPEGVRGRRDPRRGLGHRRAGRRARRRRPERRRQVDAAAPAGRARPARPRQRRG